MGVKIKYLTGAMEIRKSLGMGLLNDYYGALLTQHQSEIVAQYYDLDLSLAEIAERYGISRQAVRDVLVRSEQKLRDFESALGLAGKLSRLAAELDALCESKEEGGALRARLKEIIREVKEI